MNHGVKIMTLRPVEDAQVIFVRAATYGGSDTFGGVFEVWDVDRCYRTDADSGRLTIAVRCQPAEAQDGDTTLELVLHDQGLDTCVGYSGVGVARIGLN